MAWKLTSGMLYIYSCQARNSICHEVRRPSSVRNRRVQGQGYVDFGVLVCLWRHFGDKGEADWNLSISGKAMGASV